MADKTIAAFDVYGTVLSTESIVNSLKKRFDSAKAQSISTLWRRYQLEYTWRLNSMGKLPAFFVETVSHGILDRYVHFSVVTKNSLLHALAEHGEHLGDPEIEDLVDGYNYLTLFPDAKPALSRIDSDASIHAVLFSNGTESMATQAVMNCKDLHPVATTVFKDLATADQVERFKPTRNSYMHLVERVGKDHSQMGEVWLISSNPFDIVGARNVGMNAIWVDRAGKGWQDACVPELQPTAIVHSLEQIMDEMKGHKTC